MPIFKQGILIFTLFVLSKSEGFAKPSLLVFDSSIINTKNLVKNSGFNDFKKRKPTMVVGKTLKKSKVKHWYSFNNSFFATGNNDSSGVSMSGSDYLNKYNGGVFQYNVSLKQGKSYRIKLSALLQKPTNVKYGKLAIISFWMLNEKPNKNNILDTSICKLLGVIMVANEKWEDKEVIVNGVEIDFNILLIKTSNWAPKNTNEPCLSSVTIDNIVIEETIIASKDEVAANKTPVIKEGDFPNYKFTSIHKITKIELWANNKELIMILLTDSTVVNLSCLEYPTANYLHVYANEKEYLFMVTAPKKENEEREETDKERLKRTGIEMLLDNLFRILFSP